ncbi:hypothetical protein [Tranquillimonas alkanivorans]|uniref:Uncharacterized protein n=1 Tax=Tranquillimonas alkanivorans TaxID=441119 RepID=A0A1I5WBD1_9RHOB|nr:hypothetical protein [Tranquillimonas alkanivorans]SFQ17038.1 hypothetical protein SAMN04488047_1434 [Tranquillimonas alkanivorans]
MSEAKLVFDGILPHDDFLRLTEGLYEAEPGSPDGEYYATCDEPAQSAPAHISEIAAAHGVAMLWVCPVQGSVKDGLCHIHYQDADGHQFHFDGYGTSILIRADRLNEPRTVERAVEVQEEIDALEKGLRIL